MKKTRTLKRAIATIGLDLGDRFGHYCVLDGDGEIVCEKRVRMTRQESRRCLRSIAGRE